MVKIQCSGCNEIFELVSNRLNDRLRENRGQIFCKPECCRNWQTKNLRSEKKVSSLSDGICSTCKKKKTSSELHKQTICRDCWYRYQADSYIAKKLAAIQYMGGKCVRCDCTCSHAAFHFHHKDPLTKTYDWNSLRRRGVNEIINELSKCELICSNCHAEIHSINSISDQIKQIQKNYHESFVNQSKIKTKKFPELGENRICKGCGSEFVVKLNMRGQIMLSGSYCSSKCLTLSRRKIDHGLAIEMFDELGSYSAVAKKLNVNRKSIERLIKKIRKCKV